MPKLITNQGHTIEGTPQELAEFLRLQSGEREAVKEVIHYRQLAKSGRPRKNGHRTACIICGKLKNEKFKTCSKKCRAILISRHRTALWKDPVFRQKNIEAVRRARSRTPVEAVN